MARPLREGEAQGIEPDRRAHNGLVLDHRIPGGGADRRKLNSERAAVEEVDATPLRSVPFGHEIFTSLRLHAAISVSAGGGTVRCAPDARRQSTETEPP